MNIQLGDYAEAEKWCLRALKNARQFLGEKHSWTAEFTGNLGLIYLLQGRYPEAVSVLQGGYDMTHRVFGDHWDTHTVLANLIRAYVGWGQLEKAISLREELVASRVRCIAARGKETPNSNQSVPPCGSMRYDGVSSTYTITGAGMNIWDVFDEFHFAYKTLDGNGTIEARIDNVVEYVTRFTRPGIMMRDSMEPTSKRASVFIGQGGIIAFECRTKERGPMNSRRICVGDLTLPHWIKLQRQGNSFTAYHASNGLDWEEIQADDPNQPVPVEVTMNEVIHIGLAVTSADVVRTVEARISKVSTTGAVYPSGPFTESKDISLLAAPSLTSETIQIDPENIKDR